MRAGRALAATLALVAVMACAGAPIYPRPPASAESIAASETDVDLSEYFADGKRVGATDLYFASFGAERFLGLVGVIGGMANRARERETSGRLSGELAPGDAFDLRARTRTALTARGSAVTPGGGGEYLVSPLLAIQVSRDDRVRTAFAIRVREAERDWTGFYFYHLDAVPDAAALEGERVEEYFARVAEELDTAVPALVQVVVNDLTGRYPKEFPVEIESRHFQQWDLVPFAALKIGSEGDRSVFRVNGKPALAVLPFVMGVHVFGASQFRYVTSR